MMDLSLCRSFLKNAIRGEANLPNWLLDKLASFSNATEDEIDFACNGAFKRLPTMASKNWTMVGQQYKDSADSRSENATFSNSTSFRYNSREFIISSFFVFHHTILKYGISNEPLSFFFI